MMMRGMMDKGMEKSMKKGKMMMKGMPKMEHSKMMSPEQMEKMMKSMHKGGGK